MKKFFSIFMVLVLMLASGAFAAEVGLTDFSTTDLDGNTVTQEIFSDYDLTMINVWATWCGYCIEEMPALAELKTRLPENVNLITVCDDAEYEPELVQQILTESGANFQTLKPTQEMISQLLAYAYAFPTTFFVDSEGVLVVQPLSGVPSLEDPAGAYLTVIEKVLEIMES